MRLSVWFLIVLATLTVGAAVSSAQSEPKAAASANVGVVSGESDTGVTAGGALLFDVHERLSLEGQGAYLSRGRGTDAFNVGAGVLVNLVPARERLVPYAAVGGGVYHISFDLSDRRFLGPVSAQFGPGSSICPAPGSAFGSGPGPGFGAGAGSCPNTVAGYWGVGALPHFYARRLGALAFPGGGAWETRSFTDPAMNVGGGLRFNVNRRVMIRPDARALLVFADGETHALGVFVVHVGYRF